MSDSVRPHRWQPTRLPHPWDSPGKNTGVGCHFLLHCMKVKSQSEVAQSCPTLSDPMDCSIPGSSVHGIFQARVLEWGAIAFSRETTELEEKPCSDLGRWLSSPEVWKQFCISFFQLGQKPEGWKEFWQPGKIRGHGGRRVYGEEKNSRGVVSPTFRPLRD